MATTSILKGSNGIVNAGKRGVYQIWTSKHSSSQSLFRRTAHTSVYDKNVDELPSSMLPDEVIKSQSEKYWAPHPKTGVFGPASEQNSAVGSSAAEDNHGQGTVLEEKAWFRPTSLEDLEKPHHP